MLPRFADAAARRAQALPERRADNWEVLHTTFVRCVRQPRASAAAARRSPRPDKSPSRALTHREQQVLRGVFRGMTNKEIGVALGISYETVKEHVQHILRKIGVTDRTQAAVWAVRKGLV